MKQLSSLSLIFLLATGFCFGQTKDVRQLDFFNAIHVGGNWEVIIEKGGSEKVLIEAENGPIEKIITEVDGSTLKIRLEKWSSSLSNRFRDVKIYVTFTELGKVYASGSGDITLKSALESDDVMLKCSGSGTITTEGRIYATDDIKIENSGSSKIYIQSTIEAGDDAEISNSGSGRIIINSFFADELAISNSGSAGVEINGGEVDAQSIRLSGSGKMKMEDMRSNACEIRKSGSGSVYVGVKDVLSGSSSGSGNVYVKHGQPKLDFNFSGSGKIVYL